MADKKSEMIVIKEFFGFRQGQDLKDFALEVRQLSAQEKLDLASAASRELGMTDEQCAFARTNYR